MNAHDKAHLAEHRFAADHGFYRLQVWWIDSFRLKRGDYYKYSIVGRNDMREGDRFFWSVPAIAGRPYAFALKSVQS